jgi:hypothetical protein
MVEGQAIEKTVDGRRLPTLRNAWAALLLSLIVFIAVFGALVVSLS